MRCLWLKEGLLVDLLTSSLGMCQEGKSQEGTVEAGTVGTGERTSRGLGIEEEGDMSLGTEEGTLVEEEGRLVEEERTPSAEASMRLAGRQEGGSQLEDSQEHIEELRKEEALRSREDMPLAEGDSLELKR